jgi:hypothetical protein
MKRRSGNRRDAVVVFGLAAFLAIPLVIYAVTHLDVTGTFSGTTVEYGLSIQSTINQSGAGGYTALWAIPRSSFSWEGRRST